MDPIILCILIPFISAIASLMMRKSLLTQRICGLIGMIFLCIAAGNLFLHVYQNGIQASYIGNWQPPFGIILVADLTSAIMVLVTAIIGIAVAIYSIADIDPRREKFGYWSFLHFMLMGICGAFLTGDIFNLFVWFEVLLISSFALMCLGGARAQMEGAIKYVILNLVSSVCFLAACGLLYAQLGTLNMADLAVRVQEISPPLATVTAMLFLVAFGLKAGIFPLFFWLPASYHTPPVAISAIFAGLLTKVGVYALIRIFTLIFITNIGFTHGLLLILASLTMITGVLGAMSQYDFRRLLSFHIISQVGYMILGLALYTPLALAGTVFYLFHHIIVKSNLYLISGITHRTNRTFDLKKMGGLYTRIPWLAVLFLIPALSLGGIPPLSGFFAKFTVIKAALQPHEIFTSTATTAGAVALLVGLLTLYSMIKIWNEAFWKTPDPTHSPRNALSPRTKWLLYSPCVFLASITVLIGIFPGVFFDVAMQAAEQLMNPQSYIQTVLRGHF